MYKKKVWRYYCEFCGKGSGNPAAIQKHELYCTKNPNRICRMCKLIGVEQKPMSELLKLLPDDSEFILDAKYGIAIETIELANTALTELQEETEACPACTLATIRQKGGKFVKAHLYDRFDFKQQAKIVMGDYKHSKSLMDVE